jgi:opacity protein-like surface antigen
LIKRTLLAVVVCLLVVPVCQADSLKDRLAIGLFAGIYEPQDAQGGGFRFSGTAFGGGGEREVEIDNGLRVEFNVQYGLLDTKKVKTTDLDGNETFEVKDRRSLLALEFEVSYFEEGIGAESAFEDPDASSLQRVPITIPGQGTIRLPVGATGDERKHFYDLGTITLVPVGVNVLWHFGFRRGQTSTYIGGGPAWVFTEWKTGGGYSDFVGYNDGKIDDGPALNAKGGLQVWLSERWIYDFHANYLYAKEQFHWQGVQATFDTQAFDLTGDEVPDVFGQPADYRWVEHGNLRIDGLALSVGMRYAFPVRNKADRVSPSRKKRGKEDL